MGHRKNTKKNPPNRPGPPNPSDRSDQTDRSDRSDRSDRTDQTDRSDLASLDSAAATSTPTAPLPSIRFPEPGGKSLAGLAETDAAAPAPEVAGRHGVLVVGENDWSRQMILTLLTRLRVPLAGATSGAEALARGRENPPAVVVSDWLMADMDAPALCLAMRADKALASVHFLVLTSYAEPENLARAFESSVDDFLSKPVKENELRARVHVGLRLNAVRREAEQNRHQAEATAERLRKVQERLRETMSRLDMQIQEIAELQASFLPARFPPVGDLAFAALCRPCSEVGGDYYDVFAMPDGRVCITVADVTGHGARAAVCMAMTRSLTRAVATRVGPDDGPASFLSRLNDWLCDQLVNYQFVTMWIGLWNPKTAEIRYSRAGHPPGILLPAGGRARCLSERGVTPLGVLPFDESPPEEVLQLHPSDRLFLYTDGWTESVNADGNALEVEGFVDAIEETDGLALESVPLALYFRLERYLANAAINDDVSLLILERNAAAPAPERDIPKPD